MGWSHLKFLFCFLQHIQPQQYNLKLKRISLQTGDKCLNETNIDWNDLKIPTPEGVKIKIIINMVEIFRHFSSEF